jgi:hypothetical protein
MSLLDVVQTLLDKVGKEGHEQRADEPEKNALLNDREGLLQAVNQTKDNHLSKIIMREDSIRDNEDKMGKILVNGKQNEEYHRNRQRVTEIHAMSHRYKTEIGDRLAKDRDDFG